MSKHEPLRANEVFVGNTNTGIPHDVAHLKTVRLGDQAYDIYGNPIPEPYKPLIVGMADYDEYNRIRERQLSRIRRGLL